MIGPPPSSSSLQIIDFLLQGGDLHLEGRHLLSSFFFLFFFFFLALHPAPWQVTCLRALSVHS